MSEIREKIKDILYKTKVDVYVPDIADKILSLLPDISMIEHVGKCNCLIHQVAKEYFRVCPNCQGAGEITRPATLEEVVSTAIALCNAIRGLESGLGCPSGGILKIKEGKGCE